MTLPKFHTTMSEVETLLNEKYASGQPHGMPPDAAINFGRGGNPAKHWRSVRTMNAETKERVQETLDRLSEKHNLGALVLSRDKRRYCARVAGVGPPHRLVSIVRKDHKPVTVFYREEVFL